MGRKSAKIDDSVTSLRDIEYFRSMDRAKFSKKPDYVISKIVDGPKQTLIGPRYRFR